MVVVVVVMMSMLLHLLNKQVCSPQMVSDLVLVLLQKTVLRCKFRSSVSICAVT